MKLNWFSPLPPSQTGIADYTLALLPSLTQKAELVFWTNQSQWHEEIEQYGKVIRYQEQNLPWTILHEADLNIYHIGNNPLFHKEIWEISRRCSGLVILHDTKLLHFFTELYLQYYNDQESYLKQIKHFYGVKAAQIAGAIWERKIDINFMVDDYPLTPLALKNSLATIVHNYSAYKELKQNYSQLLAYLPLSYKSLSELPEIKERLISKPYQIIIFGFLGTNRRLEPFLRAFSAFSSRNCFELTICGQLEQKNETMALIQSLDLEDQVSVKGFLPEEDLEKALSQADLAINLRYPTMGEASISQLRIWSHGLPSFVTRTGWYGELPEDTVIFIDPDDEVEDIRKKLQKFLDNPQLFREIGKKGRKILEEQHTTEAYTEGLLTIAQKACELRYRSTLDHFTGIIGRELGQWWEEKSQAQGINEISEALFFFLGTK